MEDSYLSLGKSSEGFYKEKGSKFYAFAWPVKNQTEIDEHLQAVRKQFYDARHVCYAWRLGPEAKMFRANDDGEPSHSAGDPILNELRSQELSDALVAVVRYFGGTKLGVGGLIRAYGTAAREALAENVIREIILSDKVEVRFPYDFTSQVKKALHPFKLEPDESEYGLDVRYIFYVRKSISENFKSVFRDLTILVEKENT